MMRNLYAEVHIVYKSFWGPCPVLNNQRLSTYVLSHLSECTVLWENFAVFIFCNFE